MTPEYIAKYNAAMRNSLSPAFTEEEAITIIDHFGVPSPGSIVSVGVCKAVEKLGGKTRKGLVINYPIMYNGINVHMMKDDDGKFLPFRPFR